MKSKMTIEEKRELKRNRKWFKKKRFIIPIIIFSLLLMIGVFGEAPEEDLRKENGQGDIVVGDVDKNEEDEDMEGVSYKIISKDDVSTGVATRYSLKVEVKGKPNKKDLEKISQEVIEEIKEEDKFNAVIIEFYDYKEYIGYGFTFGRTIYAPQGDWGKANEVKAGKYKTMDYKYELKEKDWELQLTHEEAKITKEWNDLINKKWDEIPKDSLDTPDENKVNEEIANEFNITTEKVKELMLKLTMWTISDIK